MATQVREPGPGWTTPRLRVMLADDDADARMLLRERLEREGSFSVVWEAADGLEALDAVTQFRPDLVILDLAMPQMDGLEAATEIRKVLPETRIVVHSSLSAGRMAQVAIDAGADVYVENAAGMAGLLPALDGLVLASAAPAPPAGAGSVASPSGVDAWWETAELLEAAVSASPVGALLFDSTCRLVIANPVADRLLGGTALLGVVPTRRRVLWADTREPVREEDLPLQAACAGTPFDDVELVITDDLGPGGGTYVRLSGRPVRGPEGAPAGAVISVLDVTAAHKAAAALAATDEELRRSNAELASFASTASHDLAQPLMKIHGYAEMLQEMGLEDPRARDFVERILHGSERMRAFIRDLLSFSKVTSTSQHLEAVALSSLVEEVADLFEEEILEARARLEVGPLPTVVADPTQLSHLFQNLVGNSLTYVAVGVAPEISIGSTRRDGEWLVTVADNGIGIAPQDRERAFRMFERLDTVEEYAGTGIGLAVCAKIVERHRGRIWIEGEPGQGTRICFTLPDRPEA